MANNAKKRPTGTKSYQKKDYRSKKGGTGGTKPTNSTYEALNRFTKQMSKSSSVVFPEASMSMQALGNPITSPGQDNFIESWNTIFSQSSVIAGRPSLSFTRANTKRIPNAMRIDVCPYFGATAALTNWGTVSDPLQIAASNLKQFIDTSFGTVTSYDSQDLMLYLMAVQAIYPLIAEIKRDFALAVTYQENVYPQFIPRGMFALLKISDGEGNYENGEGAIYTAQHLRSWIDEFNQILFAFNKLPVPPEIAAFGYNDDLWSAIFMDTNDSQTAQLYAFRLTEYWSYEEDATPYPMLVPHTKEDPMSVGAKIEFLRTMVYKLTALQTSSTAMIQNLYNAYGSKELLKVSTVEDIKPIEFVYDPNILCSIENMAMMPDTSVIITPIVADPTYQRCEGHILLNSSSEVNKNVIVNLPLQFHKEWKDVTKEDIGHALRMHPSLRTWKDLLVYTGTDDPYRTTALTADGYTGFIIPRGCEIATLGDSGSFELTAVVPNSNTWMYLASDFAACPIALLTLAGGNHTEVRAYMAKRDIELTYRLEDVRMFWTFLTGVLYGSDLNRNFTGTRLK